MRKALGCVLGQDQETSPVVAICCCSPALILLYTVQVGSAPYPSLEMGLSWLQGVSILHPQNHSVGVRVGIYHMSWNRLVTWGFWENKACSVFPMGTGRRDILSPGSMRGDPKKWEFIYKKLYIYSYMFTLQSPSKYSPFDAIHLLSCFFHCSEQFLNSLILMPFNVAGFCFTSCTSANHFPLRTFSAEETKTVARGKIRWIGRVGHMLFLVKNCWTLSTGRAGVLVNHLPWMGKHIKRVFKNCWTQPLTTMPAGTLIHMGSWSTHLAGEFCTTRGPPFRR